MRKVLESGMLTSMDNVSSLENRISAMIGAKCVGVSSATAGLMLLFRALKVKGYVLMPSFTFSASAHAVAWNSLEMRFADIDSRTFCLDPEDVAEKIDARCGCIFAVPMFGAPCDVKALQEIADDRKVPLLYDSAHAFGSKCDGRYLGGFGDAEVFSFSPAKVVTACEGGVVCTNAPNIAKTIRSSRNYGSADEDCEHVGLNARMTELSAIVADAQLDGIEDAIMRRGRIEKRYRSILSKVPGVSFQSASTRDRPNHQTFAILIDPKRFGMDRNRLGKALACEHIETRRYFMPIHHLNAYKGKQLLNRSLPITEDVSSRILVLPLHTRMDEKDASKVAVCIVSIHERADEVSPALRKKRK
jgi:dTDP-4-amino-4,6-dideoxygalactose transaminase